MSRRRSGDTTVIESESGKSVEGKRERNENLVSAYHYHSNQTLHKIVCFSPLTGGSVGWVCCPAKREVTSPIPD